MRCLRLPYCGLMVALALSGAACGGGGELLGRLSPASGGGGGATGGGTGVGGMNNLAGVGGGGMEPVGGAGGAGGAGGDSPVTGLGPFGPAVLVAELSDPDAGDEDPSVTGDLLELFFASNRAGEADIWASRRSSPNDAWGPPSLVNELNSPEIDRTPSVSLDGLTLWFSSDRPAAHQGENIWLSTRLSRDSAWSEPAEVVELNTNDHEVGPATDEDDLVMMFGSYRDDANVYVSARLDRSSPWSSPISVGELNTGADEWDVFVNDRGLQVFFISNRSGNDDLYQAARESLSSPFAPAVPLTELNTSFQETDPALSRDQRQIFFGSNRSGNPEIYMATR